MKRKFNLSLDDLSPHPRAGLNFESIGWCDKIIENFPELKINLFVPAAYTRLGDDKAYYISQDKDWLEKLKKLSPDNYRINVHGMFHRRISKAHGNSNNDEWQYLGYSSAEILRNHMAAEFVKAGLYKYGAPANKMHPLFRPTFRPPGWKISRGAVQALQSPFSDGANGVNCFAGSKEYYEKVKDVLRVKWVSYNWDLTGPCKETGDVVAYGHTSDWTNNYMNEERYKLLKDFLDNEEVEFRWIEEM